MLIEQIIEFQFRGPLVKHVFLQLVILMTKQKFLRANYYLLVKCNVP